MFIMRTTHTLHCSNATAITPHTGCQEEDWSTFTALLVATDQLMLCSQQGGSSNDICLRPHGVVASRTPSRGDSAADVVMDKAITPALLEQGDKVAPNTTAPW